MTSSTSTGGALHNAAKVVANENNVVIKVEPLTQLTIQSPPQGQIEIQAGADIASIKSLKFVRHGDNLEIFTVDGTRPAVIIEGYYAQETHPDIYGIDEQGHRYTWSSIGATSLVGALTDGESSVQEAAPAAESTADAAAEKQDDDDHKGAAGLFGLSPGWAAAAAGLAAAAVAGGVIAATHGGGSDNHNSNSGSDDNGGNGTEGDGGNGGGTTGPTGTLSNIQFINDNDPANPTVITNGMTNDSTPTITGKVTGAHEGDRVVIKDGDKVLGYSFIDKDGNWSFTPIQDLSDGAHQISAELQDANGNVGDSQHIGLVIDTTAPDAAGNITVDGHPAGDNTPINNNKPVIGGDAEPGSTITITDGNGNVIGSAVTDGDGHWEVTPEVPLDEGDNNLGVTVTDPAGNSTSSTIPPINIDTTPSNGDTTAPTGTISELELINDNDPANPTTITNGITNDPTPVIKGHVDGAEAGDRVAIKDGDTLLGYADIDANGDWTYTPTESLGDGPHQITAELQDAAGNAGHSQQVAVNVDTTPPDAASNITVDGHPAEDNVPTNNTKPVIGGDAEPGSTVTITDGAGNVIGSAVTDADGHWEITPEVPLDENVHDLGVTVTDPAGNGTSSQLPITIDTTPPTGTLSEIELINDNDPANPTSITNGLTNDPTPVIKGHVDGAEAGDRVAIKDGDTLLGYADIDANGDWTYTPTESLGDGPHQITAELQDAAGNAGHSQQVAVNIDTTPPDAASNITVDGHPAEDNVPTNNTKPVIGGDAEPGSTVTITDGAGNVIGSAVTDADGHWEITPEVPLDENVHDLGVTVTDPAGNGTSSQLPITIDTTPPTGTLSDIQLINDNDPANPSNITNGLTNDSTPVIKGHVDGAEAGDRVAIKDGDTLLGYADIDANGDWTFTPTEPLDDNQHSLTIELQDRAGNVGDSHQVDVTVDTTPPDAASNIQVNGQPEDGTNSTHDSTPTISGNAEPDCTVTITDGAGNVIGSAVADQDGHWEITPTDPLADGSNNLGVTVTDPAGNSTSSGLPISVAPEGTTTLKITDDDSKVIDASHPTKDTTPTFSGQVNGDHAGETVLIKDQNGTVIGSATVGADGTWTYTVPDNEALGDDTYQFTANLKDAQGTEGPPSNSVTCIVDTVPPTGNTTIEAKDSDSNVIDADHPTKDTTPTFSGKVTPSEKGEIIIIKDGDTVLGSTIADDDGNWTFTPTNPLEEAPHSITATVTDAAGNVGNTSDPIEYTQDNTAPTGITTIEAKDSNDNVIDAQNPTKDTTPTFSGKVTPSEKGEIIIIKDGDTVLGSTIADDDGNWTFKPEHPLEEKDHSITATVTDAAGNVGSTSNPIEYTQDNTAPTGITTIEAKDSDNNVIDANHPTKDTTPTFSGKVTPSEKGEIITIKDGDTVLGSTIVDDDGNWTFTPEAPLGEKDHSITATVSDAAGNVGNTSDPINYTQDNTPPAAATDIIVTNDNTDVTVPAGGSTNDNTPTISGKAEAGCTVNILDKDGNVIASTTADADGNWRTPVPALADGDYNEMQVEVVDKAGNASDKAAVPDFTVDTTNTNTTTINTDAQASDPQPTFSGKVTFQEGDSKDNVTVTIKDKNGVVIAENIPVNADGTWTYTPTDPLAAGAHNISAVVVDQAHNESAPGYLNGTEDGGWTVPAVLYSEALQGEGDMFGYTMMVSDQYLYIGAPQGGLNASNNASQQGIIYAIKKEFAYLLDGSTSIEKLFAQHTDMGTIITNNSDLDGNGTPESDSFQGYTMRVLDDGWVVISSHYKDAVYFVKEPLSASFDLNDIASAPGGHSDQGFLVHLYSDYWNRYNGFNVESIKNADGTLTFMMSDISGPYTEAGVITTVTFDPTAGWGNITLTQDTSVPGAERGQSGWVPRGDLPAGMEVGHISHQDNTGAQGSIQNYNFGADIVNVGDIFGDGGQYLAIADPESTTNGQGYRGTWYFYRIPEDGLPKDFSIQDVDPRELFRIQNIGAGFLNELDAKPNVDDGSREFQPHNHNIATLGSFSNDQDTDIAIASSTDNFGGANGKVWVLHSNKLPPNFNIGINNDVKDFDTNYGYGIISTNHASSGQGFGLNVVGGYDFNGDGTQDLIVSDPLAVNAKGQVVGAIYVIYGGHEADYQDYLKANHGQIDIQDILNNGWGEVHYGNVPNQMFGWSVDVLDMNNDGHPDLLVGAPSQIGGYTTDQTTGELTNPQYNGQVYVIYNTHQESAQDTSPAARGFSLPTDEPEHHDTGIPLLLDGDHQNVDLATLTDALKDTHSIDMSNGDNTLKVNNQTLDSWEGADGDALIVSGENGLVQLTGGIDNWHSNGTVTVDGKVYTEYQSSGMAEVLIDDRIHVNIL
ncbi:Ig-like domain-containing protein [Pantoea sp. At-9b]|uniref:Ig-like domain-containing protein n=1 Tax=Pantoea sp. (strain At-9b) TaxID=592316 RepID=UPI0001F25E81|nr:Ig-like domain-containing protein [Pantoea sp. At-9b]ADU68742.1 outer membrane adhesin like protein [Pantoea sp. At-9b]